MNNLTPIIEKYLTRKYRGIDCFQNETFLDDIYNIYAVLDYINQNNGCVDVKSGSESFKNFCECMDLTENGLRKNVFPTLERIGLIKKTNTGKSWERVCLTDTAKSMIELSDEDLEEAIRKSFRTLLNDNEFGQVIKRIKSLISECSWGKICWWEVWFCLKLDIDFEVVKSDVRSIRNLYKLKSINKADLEKITDDFDKHCIQQGDFNPYLNCHATKGKGIIDFNNLRNKITNALGVKLVHYGLRVDNRSALMTVDTQMSRNNRRVNRNYKRTSDILIDGINPSEFDYHHMVPFDNSHFNPDLHKEIDDIRNLIPITEDDHKKFPNKRNHYLIVNVTNENKIRFHSIHDLEDYIELEKSSHINLEKFKEVYIPYNRNLYKKIKVTN